ncbi:hypothetical protein HOLleu_01123 [Holothuria leucospilota]|uniref:C2H2-type domain-containing protein n=1 Tax=Holothuria leucospilota TaxID=206669 RepID=A0A9Q1CNW3_HOLLE|nr:hypothetical protein HOLleu_01123 [Holothuria leucospilota]
MISGMTLHPGVEYTREIMRQEYLTLASLDCRPKMNRGETNLTAHLVLKCDSYEHVLCTLQQGIVHQQILNFVLYERESLTLTVEGTGIIHVTGYSMEHPVLSDGMTGGTETTLMREVYDGIQDGGNHSSNHSSDGDQSTIVDEDSVSEIKCESQYRCDQESAETEEAFCQQFNDECNQTDGVTVDAIYKNDIGSEPVETSDMNMDTKHNTESITKDTVYTYNIVQDPYNCLPNVKAELEQETDQNINSRNALLTNEETVGAIASYESISSVTESLTNVMDSKDHRQTIGENTLSSDNVSQGTGICTSHVNTDTEEGSDQHLNSSKALLTSNETESAFDSNESTYAPMESSTLELDRNNHRQSSVDEVEGALMVWTFSDEKVLASNGGNIVQETICYLKKEEAQTSCELFERNVGNEVNLEAIESRNVQLDTSLHQAHSKPKCPVLLKRIDQSDYHHPDSHLGERSFNCQICGEIFSEKDLLAIHQQNHTMKQVFTNQSSVKVLNGQSTFKCQLCMKDFNTRNDLKKHGSIHVSKKTFKGNKCRKKFNHKVHLKVHERIHTGQKTSKSNHYLKRFNCRTVGKVHEENHVEGKIFTCEYCKKEFCQKAELKQHQKIHTTDKPFTCENCGKQFINKGNLKQHERTHTGERPFSCNHCDRKFSQKAALINHEKLHTGERPYSCKHCDRKFIQKKNLRLHERIHTGERPFSCKHCDMKFSQKKTLKQHERTHTGERPFSCKHCDRKFSQKATQMRHERIHTGERPFSCKYCGRKFSQKASQMRHERIHTGESPYSCKHCDRKFSRKESLKQHERIHIGERPFSCKHCERKFSQKATQMRHERIHSGESPYSF